MNSFKQHLLGEAFDKPYSFQKTHTVFGDDGYDYVFKTEDGRKGEINIAKMDASKVGIMFSIDGTQKITGKGDAFRIFATVRAALDDALKTIPNVKRISFTGQKPKSYGIPGHDSRGSLYDTFAKKMAKHYNMHLAKMERGAKYGDPGATTFLLVKESLDKPYKFTIEKHSQEWFYNFKLENGRHGQVDFMFAEWDGNTHVDFAFDIDGEISTTGGGDQFRIFATVKAALIHFLENYPKKNIHIIRFEGSKDSARGEDAGRVRLYHRFAKEIAKKYKMRLSTSDERWDVVFKLIKEDCSFKQHINEENDKKYVDSKDMPALSHLIKMGDEEVRYLATSQFSVQLLNRVAKKYHGIKTRRGILVYMGSYTTTSGNGPFATQGQAGYGGTVNAEITFQNPSTLIAKRAREEFEKRFVINEEYVDHTMRNGDVWKNPTSREFEEYLKELPTIWDFGGCLDKKGDLYLFTDGLHEDLEISLKLGRTIKFRGERTPQKKIIGLSPSGGHTAGIDKKMLEDLIKVYKHKSLHHHFDTDVNEVFSVIRASWNGKFADFVAIMKKHGIQLRNTTVTT